MKPNLDWTYPDLNQTTTDPKLCSILLRTVDISYKMTTYIPSITIPTSVFLNPAASILLPVALGTAVGYSTRRKPSFKTYYK